MFVKFENLPSHSRVWIYQSDRKFTTQEEEFISEKAILFIDQWTKHGADLQGSFEIKYNQFLVLAVDEGFNNVSGCSIDSSVRFIQALEQTFDITLLDKMNVTYRNKNTIEHIPLKEFRTKAKKKKVNSDVIVFNNLVLNKMEYDSLWEVPASSSWHARYF